MKPSSYSLRLNERFAAKRAAARKKVTETPAPEADVPTPEGSHPGRYPKHKDPLKGQTYEGECNTTLCERHEAVFFNRATFGLYCVCCARGQNGYDPVPVSILVDEKPSLEEMEKMRAEMMKALSRHRRISE